MVESLTRQGFEVYLTDWVPPARKDNWRGFDDYVNCELYDAVNAATRHAGVEQVNLLGYCFGGLLSVIWTALYPDAIKNLVTLATPIDASVEGSPLYTLAARLPDQVLDSILDLHGNCPAVLNQRLVHCDGAGTSRAYQVPGSSQEQTGRGLRGHVRAVRAMDE